MGRKVGLEGGKIGGPMGEDGGRFRNPTDCSRCTVSRLVESIRFEELGTDGCLPLESLLLPRHSSLLALVGSQADGRS